MTVLAASVTLDPKFKETVDGPLLPCHWSIKWILSRPRFDWYPKPETPPPSRTRSMVAVPECSAAPEADMRQSWRHFPRKRFLNEQSLHVTHNEVIRSGLRLPSPRLESAEECSTITARRVSGIEERQAAARREEDGSEQYRETFAAA